MNIVTETHFKFILLFLFLYRGNVGKHLSQLSRAADSLCDGDLVDKCVRTGQQWGLLPTQVCINSITIHELVKHFYSLIVICLMFSCKYFQLMQD